MTDNRATCNPHPVIDGDTLARIHDRILDDLIALRRAGDLRPSRLRLAGIPSLPVLELEAERRRATRLEVA